MGFTSKVVLKFSVAAVALASIVGCGSGSAKPFSAATSTSAPNSSNTVAAGTSPASSVAATSSTTAPAASSSAPAPNDGTPQDATVIAGIQNQQGWQTCGGCGNVGGVGQGPDYHLTQGIENPSLSGHAADFFVNGGPAYTGGYYFIEQPTLANPLTYLRYEFDLYIPGQYASAPQALEFEVQQTVNGDTYNFAWQADYASNGWTVFNYTTKSWEPTGIPLQRFAPDSWHHISATFHTAGTQAIHDALVVDGQTFTANISHQATHTGTRVEFTNGFQVDLNSASSPYHVFVDNMKVTVAD